MDATNNTAEAFTVTAETMHDDGSWSLTEDGGQGTRRNSSQAWGDAVEVRLLRKNDAGLWSRVD